MHIRAFTYSILSACLLIAVSPLWAGTINLAWNASATATSYKLYYGTIDGPPYDTVVDTGPATTASLAGLTNGTTYYFAATSSNEEGESSYSNEVSAVPSDLPPPDTIPPTVAITFPGNGTVQRKSTVTITATASDNVGVTRVEFYVNGALPCPADTASPYSCAWNVPNPSNRTYTLQAKAFDSAGNMGVSAVITVTSN